MNQEEFISREITTRLKNLENFQKLAEESNIDPLKKQELIIQCRLEYNQLKIAVSNIKDIGSKLDVVIGFLSGIETHLFIIDGKLDNIQADISIIKDELKSLIQTSPITVIKEWSARTLRSIYANLPDKVYVEALVCEAGPNNDFQPLQGVNTPQLVISDVFKHFLKGIYLL